MLQVPCHSVSKFPACLEGMTSMVVLQVTSISAEAEPWGDATSDWPGAAGGTRQAALK
jgi:hypothetical protein